MRDKSENRPLLFGLYQPGRVTQSRGSHRLNAGPMTVSEHACERISGQQSACSMGKPAFPLAAGVAPVDDPVAGVSSRIGPSYLVYPITTL